MFVRLSRTTVRRLHKLLRQRAESLGLQHAHIRRDESSNTATNPSGSESEIELRGDTSSWRRELIDNIVSIAFIRKRAANSHAGKQSIDYRQRAAGAGNNKDDYIIVQNTIPSSRAFFSLSIYLEIYIPLKSKRRTSTFYIIIVD